MTNITAPGALDPDFNGGARQTITPSGLASKIHSLLPLASGAMLVASSGDPASTFAVNLFNADGSLPPPELFGNSVSSRGHGYLLDSFSSARPIPQLHAYRNNEFHVLSFQREGVHMARYNAAGLPQARYLIDFSALPTGAVAEGPMLSAADGELLYVAFTVTLLNADTLVAVMCITADGVLNPAFNGTGVQLIHLPDNVTRASALRGLAVQRHGANAGKVVLAGGWAAGAADEGLYLTRLSTNGEPDSTFGERGFAWVAADQYRYMQLIVDPADTLKLCGSVRDREASPRTREVAIAWDAEGAVDRSFNDGLALLETFAGTNAPPTPVFFSSSELAGGYRLACLKYFNSQQIIMAALDGTGQMDEAMGRVGLAVGGGMGNATGGAVAHDVDGKMLASWGITVFRVLGQ